MTKTTAKNGDGTQPPAPDCTALETLAGRYALSSLDQLGRFERAIALAQGIVAIKTALGPIMPLIMPLMNSPLGFMCDLPSWKDPSVYPVEVVRDCLIEATLRGLYPVGNEFNIISSRCYPTLAGYRRLVRELVGLTDLVLQPDSPRSKAGQEGGCVVPFVATWKFRGQPQRLERAIPVRLTKGQGADAAIGKATRKMLASIHAQVTGSDHGDADAPEIADAPLLPDTAAGDRVLGQIGTARADATAGELASPAQLGRLAALSKTIDADAWEQILREEECTTEEVVNLSAPQAQRLIDLLEDGARERAAIEQE